jgi:hypothetical protein
MAFERLGIRILVESLYNIKIAGDPIRDQTQLTRRWENYRLPFIDETVARMKECIHIYQRIDNPSA